MHLESPLEAMQAGYAAQDYEPRAAWGSRLYYLLGCGDQRHRVADSAADSG
ncbi:MAG: hypothetical protein M3461_15760 [Pseudomonadota bacterium]|nr:hypothetical protein [Pseudomonadota bacterium]